MTVTDQGQTSRDAPAAGASAAGSDNLGDSTSNRLLSLAFRHGNAREMPRAFTPDLGFKELSESLAFLYACISANEQDGRSGTRPEEWLLDNRHIIEQTLEDVRKDLPGSYVRQLPKVTEDAMVVIRVQELARLLLKENAKPLDIHGLERSVEVYQSRSVLSIGELWALPALLRVAILKDLVTNAGACLAEVERLRAEDVAEDRLAAEIRVDDVAGAIVSLRQLGTHDWRESFERLCRVDRVLRRDPARAYRRMDFESRDRYRGAVEELARGTHRAEIEIAEHVVDLCRRDDPEDHRTRHVGYHLVSAGRPSLEKGLQYRLPPGRAFIRHLFNYPVLVYFGLLLAMTALPLFALAGYLLWQGAPPLQGLAVTVLMAVPVTGLAVAMLNGLVTWLVVPRRVPKMNFDKGIPSRHRTAVVMPVIMAGAEDVDHALERIEINYLNNEDKQLVYAVLSDWADAPKKTMPGDAAVLERAIAGIRQLNARHGRGPDRGPFLLLHRERLWNPTEGCWMGWERKRGKLSELNRLLGGDARTSYTTRIGSRKALTGVQFVITLDADTHMPPGAARRLVGTIAHPLNRAVVDSVRGTLKAGYSILQPRLEIDPDSTRSTRFTEVFAGDTTVDLYTHATSDVYHDLFAEGIYAGKGLYDWRAFEHSLRHRIPENALLSHDLLEGVLGRAALITDVVLLEQYPTNALDYMRRLHRWVRGDWQLLPWLAPFVPSTTVKWFRNPLSAIHRWKIIDNLRRSLQPPAVLALLVMTWLGLLPGPVWLWTIVFTAFLAAPLIAEVFNIAGRGLARPASLPQRIRDAPPVLRDRLEHWVLSVVLLPYESYVVLDAIGRTVVRLFITKRRLLEWTAAAHIQRRLGRRGGSSIWREMWISPALAVAGTAAIVVLEPFALTVASPLLLAWLWAPWIIAWVNRPLHEPPPPATSAERRHLRRVARRTWLFFERFVAPDNHFLPPDNYQEEPRPVLANRTSPTNVGMALVSALAAFDLGYIGAESLAARLRNTTEGMAGLERYRGHWLNWYETRELRPLEPRYVSTVDSGNLAACLLVLARGLEQIVAAPVHQKALVRGIADTVAVLAETLEAATRRHDSELAPLLDLLQRMQRRLLDANTASDRLHCVERLHEHDIGLFNSRLLTMMEEKRLVLDQDELSQVRAWLDELQRQLKQARRSVETNQPWVAVFEDVPPAYTEATEGSPVHVLYGALRESLNDKVPLTDLAERCRSGCARINELAEQIAVGEALEERLHEARAWNDNLREALEQTASASERLVTELRDLVRLCDRWVADMEFGFLYDKSRNLFRIGYNVSSGSLDPNYYDLLASEARLAGFVAIAKGDVPTKHWLNLGRPFRRSGHSTVLMSWGATLFEYLMPALFMHTPHDSLTSRACRSAIRMHREFAGRWEVPWGISESGFYQLDDRQLYQYRAFGVPGLGFRRDLGDRLVVAPYASLMALQFDHAAVLRNLAELESFRGLGLYGMYEAVDFGRTDKSVPRRARVVRSYMSHHQGMALLAIDNLLNNDVMVRRFHADRRVAGVSMMLHERLPPQLPVTLKAPEASKLPRRFAAHAGVDTWAVPVDDEMPRYNILSNGHYTLVLNARGGGGAWWDDIALTRWQPDPTRNYWGQWIYVKDLDDGTILSMGRDPAGSPGDSCTVHFGPHTARYQRQGNDLLCQMETALSSQHDIEARKVLVRNESSRSRRILMAACAEPALARAPEFFRHPAFARLFVESECLENERTLVFRRRPRNSLEKPLFLAHSLVVAPGIEYRFGWETDRARFVGRGGAAGQPEMLQDGLDAFTGTTGSVLDPVIASGMEIVLGPYQTVEAAYLSAVSRSRSELLSMLRSYGSMARVAWIFEQARMQSEQELHNLGMDPAQVPVALDLCSALLAPRLALRDVGGRDAAGQALQSVLWSRGISGDRPLVLMYVHDSGDTPRVDELLGIHTFLCARQVPIDLVLIDEQSTGYAQPTRDRMERAVSRIRSRTLRRLAGSVFIVPGKELTAEVRAGLAAAASVVLDAARGPFPEQLARGMGASALLPPFVAVRSADWEALATLPLPRPGNLLHDNGLGGFSPDGVEYVIHLEGGRLSPAPWSNVMANPEFGCLVTESGSSCTWAGNSSEQRLTPWSNDPVADGGGEAIYLRDEETGRIWTPTPRPMPDDDPYQVRHGAGYSEFRHNSPGLVETYRIHVDPDQPVKICRLALANKAGWARRITVTYYAEWVLGMARTDTAAHIDCDFDSETGALLARNAFDRLAGRAVAFLASSRSAHGLTADRTEFLGRGTGSGAPAALLRVGLSGEARSGDDPCAVYQVHLDLPAGTTQFVYFVLGQGADRAAAVELARRFRSPEEGEASYERARAHWDRLLGAVQVETPEPAMDLLLNRWLLYQTLSGRLWGRTGYYQSSGAFGFRDQLQDVMAVTWAAPELAREHILRAAGRQFQDGDVLHWWHEAPLRGVRTRCSDDLLWLPYVTSHYLRCTGDDSILQEQVSYLSGPDLRREENEHYAEFPVGDERGSLYEHCCRAIDRASTVGPHGLPTIGSGDWNDGFNRVSTTGRGESVWLAWFLVRVCLDFAPVCEGRGDPSPARRYRELAEDLRQRVESEAWDGEWYRRAYYDDGTPLGSASADECRIDLIAQTWSVMSADKPSDRARRAMESAWKRLVRQEDRLVLLLAPPFDKTSRDPGYIKAYPPGIRENGAQYTHASTWAVWAAAGLGDGDRAVELFRLLNPILRAGDGAGVERYRVEPYVLAGDIYSMPPHTGRGGWTWYSGAAAWLYRAGIEAILGLRRRDDGLELQPCLPASWTGFRARLQWGRSWYQLEVSKPRGQRGGEVVLSLDGSRIEGNRIRFEDDGREHRVDVELVPPGLGRAARQLKAD